MAALAIICLWAWGLLSLNDSGDTYDLGTALSVDFTTLSLEDLKKVEIISISNAGESPWNP